jgi:hypothetical protein
MIKELVEVQKLDDVVVSETSAPNLSEKSGADGIRVIAR